jgi:FMN-dependent NADH-azoreductase
MNITEEVIIEGHNADPSKTAEIIAEGLERVAAAAKKF